MDLHGHHHLPDLSVSSHHISPIRTATTNQTQSPQQHFHHHVLCQNISIPFHPIISSWKDNSKHTRSDDNILNSRAISSILIRHEPLSGIHAVVPMNHGHHANTGLEIHQPLDEGMALNRGDGRESGGDKGEEEDQGGEERWHFCR